MSARKYVFLSAALDIMDLHNPLLARTGAILRRNRYCIWDTLDYTIRYATRFGRREGSLFFPTRGCRHEAAGGCTMCDYGLGPRIRAEAMIDSVRRGMKELPKDLNFVKVTPSGSFLDQLEVPVQARRAIVELMRKSPYPALGFESRAETLASGALEECRSRLEGHRVRVMVGLESSDPWISKYSINKSQSRDMFVSGISRLNRLSMASCANVLLGAPFLSEKESIEDTVRTVRWALEKGSDECCIYPANVKRWTHAAWFYERGFYTPPSLWSLVEVLRRLSAEIAVSKIRINWYRSYSAYNVIHSPQTCTHCYSHVVRYVDAYAETNDYSFIEKAVRYNCRCKNTWSINLEQDQKIHRVERAVAAYEAMARDLLGAEWWKQRGQKIIARIESDAREPVAIN